MAAKPTQAVATEADRLCALGEEPLVEIICSVLQARPELAPAIVNFSCPDLTYPPTKALTERRAGGVVKSYNQEKGYGFIACPELEDIFGADVFVHAAQMGTNQVGTEVSFAVLLNKDNKPQAFDIAPAGASKGKGKGKGKADFSSNGFAGMMGGSSAAPLMNPMSFANAGPTGITQGELSKGGKGKGGKGKGIDCAEEIGQFAGNIKSFNRNSGYGFISCDALAQYGSDVFLHGAQIGDFEVGEQVMFTAFLNSQGKLQSKDLYSCHTGASAVGPGAGEGGVKRPAPTAAKGKGKGGKGPEVAEELGQFIGTIKSFKESSGYGFIDCQDLKMMGHTNDVFLHHAQMNNFQVGDQVMFTAFLNSQGKLQSKDLMPPDGGNKRSRFS